MRNFILEWWGGILGVLVATIIQVALPDLAFWRQSVVGALLILAFGLVWWVLREKHQADISRLEVGKAHRNHTHHFSEIPGKLPQHRIEKRQPGW